MNDLLNKVDERACLKTTACSLGIDHLLQHTVQQLSGENCSAWPSARDSRDVDVYFFDGLLPTSTFTNTAHCAHHPKFAETKRVIVIEHDGRSRFSLTWFTLSMARRVPSASSPRLAQRQAINTCSMGSSRGERKDSDKPIKFLHTDEQLKLLRRL